MAEKVTCVVCVKTAMGRPDRMAACRETWMSGLPADYAVVEVVGRDGPDVPRLEGARLHVDAPDDYCHLHLKVWAMLVAVPTFFDFEWLAMVDDDTYVVDLRGIVGNPRGDVVGSWRRVTPESVDGVRGRVARKCGEGEPLRQPLPATYPDGSMVVMSRRAVDLFRSVPPDEVEDLRWGSGMDSVMIGNLLERFGELTRGELVAGDHVHGLVGVAPAEMRELHGAVSRGERWRVGDPAAMGRLCSGGCAEEAFRVWMAGARMGSADCAAEVSRCLRDGDGVGADEDGAAGWDAMASQMVPGLSLVHAMPSTGASVLCAVLDSVEGFSCAWDPFGSPRGRRTASHAPADAARALAELAAPRTCAVHRAGSASPAVEGEMLREPWCAVRVVLLRRRNRLRGAVLAEMRERARAWARGDHGDGAPDWTLDVDAVRARMGEEGEMASRAEEALARRFADGSAETFWYEDLFGDGKALHERRGALARLLGFVGAPRPPPERDAELMAMLDVVPDGSWGVFEKVGNIHAVEDALGSDEDGWVFGAMRLDDCHLELMRRYFQLEGDRCRYGVGREVNEKLAVDFWTRGVRMGSVRCVANLAWAYKEGIGLDRDLGKAVELWERGAAEGDAECVRHLAWAYKEGEAVERDMARAVGLWERGRGMGDYECVRHLAWACSEGLGTERDGERAASMLQERVDEGMPEAVLDLIWLIGQGKVARPAGTIRALLRKGAAMGDAECMRGLAWQLREGSDGPADEDEAARWDEAAAEAVTGAASPIATPGGSGSGPSRTPSA